MLTESSEEVFGTFQGEMKCKKIKLRSLLFSFYEGIYKTMKITSSFVVTENYWHIISILFSITNNICSKDKG